MDTRETLSLRLCVGVICLVICIAHAASIQLVAQNGEEILVDDERPLAASAWS